MLKNNILGVILAGGKSKRFGDDKSIAKLGDKTLLDHSIEKIEKDFQEILIVTNKDIIISNKKKYFFNKRFNRRSSWSLSWSSVSYGLGSR